ncbi:hypothetical protein ACS0TY_033554 [Phlomoides rotata]
MLGLVKSCIGTKFTGQFGNLIADLAIDATTTVGVEVGQGLREVDIKKYIKVEKIPGGQLEDSKVLKRVMFNKDVVAPGAESDLACHYLSKAGVSAVKRLRKTDNNRIAKACGAVIVNRLDELQESNVGTD